MKNRMIEVLKKASRLWLAVFIIGTCSINVYASNAVTAPITQMSQLMIDIISAIGVCVVAWGGFELGNSMQTRDGSAKADALQRLAGGGLMTVIAQIVSIVTGP